MSLDEVAAYGLQARRRADTEREFWMGEARRACIYLNENKWTWARIGKFMGVNLASVYRWAHPDRPQ